MAKKKDRNHKRVRRHVRVRSKITGNPEKPRLSVYRSLTEIYSQIIDDSAGHTIVSASTIDLELRSKMKGLNKTDQANLVGKQIAERAKKKGIKDVVFDRGGYQYIGRVKALAEGAREGGLKF
ncbi:MAG: 50S ribosomal protein L18 [Anaerolineales bacterium]|jgi:large subunit ribosomal protein L18